MSTQSWCQGCWSHHLVKRDLPIVDIDCRMLCSSTSADTRNGGVRLGCRPFCLASSSRPSVTDDVQFLQSTLEAQLCDAAVIVDMKDPRFSHQRLCLSRDRVACSFVAVRSPHRTLAIVMLRGSTCARGPCAGSEFGDATIVARRDKGVPQEHT